MLMKFWSFVIGYVTLLVEGAGLEKFLNMAVSRGIYLWDIVWLDPQKIRLKVRISAIRALRHIARRTHCRFHIQAKEGLPFTAARFKKAPDDGAGGRRLSAGPVSYVIFYLVCGN